VSDFEFEPKNYIRVLSVKTIMKWKANSEIGRILMVDLEYPEELHSDSAHNDYFLAAERISVKAEKLSKYQQSLIEKFGIHYTENQSKLVPHLGNRRRYVVHYRNLQYYLSKGMKLVRVHEVVRFVQKPWLREYVLFNARLRSQAKNDFEKNLYKFFVNSIFGKSMEQVRNRETVHIISNIRQLKYYAAQSTFKSYQILNPNLVIVFMRRAIVNLNKPIYTAFTVLDLSKLFMYEWHFEKI
jgi:hypothetical protein